MRTISSLLVLCTTAAFISAAAPAFADDATPTPPQSASTTPAADASASADQTGFAEVRVMNRFVYQQTGEQDTAPGKGTIVQIDIYKTYGHYTPEIVVPYGSTYKEIELNDSFDFPEVKLPVVGKVDVNGMASAWIETDGLIFPMYGEVNRSFPVMGGKVTVTPFVGAGQWFATHDEMSRAYVQAGFRTTFTQGRISYATEAAFSHCLKEDARMNDFQCRDVAYGNVEATYDVGHHYSLVGTVKVTSGQATVLAFSVRKTF